MKSFIFAHLMALLFIACGAPDTPPAESIESHESTQQESGQQESAQAESPEVPVEAEGHAGIGEPCGGFAGVNCADGLICDMSDQDGCDVADGAGVCADNRNVACTREYMPMCGCDGQTYPNDCVRRAAGVPLNHHGECT